jgi:hypothetical protein
VCAGQMLATAAASASPQPMLAHAWLVTALNPKSFTFPKASRFLLASCGSFWIRADFFHQMMVLLDPGLRSCLWIRADRGPPPFVRSRSGRRAVAAQGWRCIIITHRSRRCHGNLARWTTRADNALSNKCLEPRLSRPRFSGARRLRAQPIP